MKLTKFELEQQTEKVRLVTTERYDYVITAKRGTYCVDKKSKKGKRYYWLVGSNVYRDKPFDAYAKQRVSMGECAIYFGVEDGR